MRRRAAIATAFAACLSGCGPGPAPRAAARPRWPALPVTGLDGRPVVLPADTGQARIVNLWALWCPPCRAELPALERLGASLAPQGVEVSALALAEDVFSVREYLSEHASRLPSAVIAPKHSALQPLAIDALPQTFVLARDGSILICWVGARDWDAPDVRADLARVLKDA